MLAVQTHNVVNQPTMNTPVNAITASKLTSTASNPLAGSITEIVLRNGESNSIPMLMPLLAQLSQDNRWLVWIAPPVLLPKQTLLAAGIDLKKVILLNPDSKHSTFQLAKQALGTGTSHAVVSWPGYLSESEFEELETAAQQGQSLGIVIRQRHNA